MVVIKLEKDEQIEEILDSLMEHLGELKELASDLRKAGLDTSMADIRMIDIPSKVKLARVTYETKDIDAIKKDLAYIKHELDTVRDGSEFDSIVSDIERTYELIRKNDFTKAQEVYGRVRDAYPRMPEDVKRIIYKASLDIHQKLSNNGRRDRDLV